MNLANGLLRLDHLAFAVCDFDRAVSGLIEHGFEVKPVEVIEHEKVKIRKSKKATLVIELLNPYPTGAGGVARFMERNGDGLHHVSVQCANLFACLMKLKECGIRTLPNYPARGSESTTVAFLHPADTGGLLIELVEV